MTKYKREESTEVSVLRPPKVEAVLLDILQKWHKKHRSAHVPSNDYDAVRFWINNQEPPNEGSDKPLEIKRDGVTIWWQTPYIDRVAYNLKKFLSESEIDKAYILDCIKIGCPYRGDNIEFLKRIRTQHNEMLNNPSEYIGMASQVLKKMRSGKSQTQGILK